LGKINLVRKFLFALQADWYGNPTRSNTALETYGGTKNNAGMMCCLIEALGVVLKAPGGFAKDDVKALVAYLAANLHESGPL
jgi:hypothetical protein